MASECVLDIPCDEGSGIYLHNEATPAAGGVLTGRLVDHCRWKHMPTGLFVIRFPIFYPTPYVRVEHYDALNQPFTENKITLEAWICLDRLPSEMNLEDEAEAWTKANYDPSSEHYGDRDFFKRSTVISKRHNGTTGYGMTIFKDDTLSCDLKGLTPDSLDSAEDKTVLQLKEWYHVVVTWDGTNIKGYVNGGLDSTVPATGSIDGNSNWLGFGRHDDYKFFKGLMSRIRIYDYALTAETIAAHYAAEAGDYGWPKFRLTDMRDLVRTVLDDYDIPYHTTDKLIDQALDQVLSEFSELHPYQLITRLPVHATKPVVDITRLEERITIDRVEYPIGDIPPTYPDFAIFADELRIKGYTETTWAGSVSTYAYCNVHWTKCHDLEDAYTTIPDSFLDLIALGAAGHLITRSSDPLILPRWTRWANNAIAHFNAGIKRHAPRRKVRVRTLQVGDLE